MTRQRDSSGGLSVENIKRLMHQRNAARVLPVPVGARIRVESPREIAGQPRICGRVGPVKTAENQSRTAGWKSSSALTGESCVGGAAPGAGGLDNSFLALRLGTLDRFAGAVC